LRPMASLQDESIFVLPPKRSLLAPSSAAILPRRLCRLPTREYRRVSPSVKTSLSAFLCNDGQEIRSTFRLPASVLQLYVATTSCNISHRLQSLHFRSESRWLTNAIELTFPLYHFALRGSHIVWANRKARYLDSDQSAPSAVTNLTAHRPGILMMRCSKKIHVSMNTTCPHCGASIPPQEEQKRR
jgi:hypothetical protein